MSSQEANRCTFGCWEDGSAVTGVRRVWGGVAALALATAGLVTVAVTPAFSAVGESGSTSGRPVHAAGGTAPVALREQIAWLSFGGHDQPIASGSTVTNWVLLGAQTRAEVTCTVTHSSSIRGYRPGSFAGDGFHYRYNSGAEGTSNQLVVGVATGTDGVQARFDVACAASLVTYDGHGWAAGNRVESAPIPFPGFVVADAESTNATSEWVEFQALAPTTNPTWRILDRNYGCTGGFLQPDGPTTNASRTGGVLRFSTVRNGLFGTGPAECSGSPGTSMAVAHADGVSTMRVVLNGSGHQAVALGYILSLDLGDAPAPYGVAGAYNLPWVNTATLGTGTTAVAGSGQVATTNGVVGYAANATQSLATPRLGPGLSFESGTLATDSYDDAFATAPSSVTATPGGTTLLSPRCRGEGYVTGWIDFNRNGQFEPAEQSNVRQCTSTTANGAAVELTWSVPGDAVAGSTYARFVVSAAAAELAPTGVVSRGEVEDHPVTLLVPRLTVTKVADAGEVPAAGQTVTYTVTMTNTGNVAFTAGAPAYIYDAYAGVDDDAELGSVTASSPGTSGVDSDNRVLWWYGAIPVGGSVTFTIPVTMRAGDPGDLVLRNTVRVSTQPLSTAQQTAPCVPGSPEETAGRCVTHELFRVGLDVTKQAFRKSDMSPLADGVDLAPGTEVVWRYTVQNTGSIALADVVLSDAVSETRTDLDGSTTSTSSPVISCPGSPAVASGTTVTIPSLAPGAERVCEAEGVVGGP